MKTCNHYEGLCCDSCHEDDAEGYFELTEVYTPDGELHALVCCQKHEDAQEEADAVSKCQPKEPR